MEETETKRQRHHSELPQALELQEKLFNELRAMGIVEMVEEMIDPQKLRPHNLSEEQYQPHNGSLWASPGKTLPGPLRQTEVSTEGVKKALNNMQKQEWQANILYPQQRENGFWNSTITIDIEEINNENSRDPYSYQLLKKGHVRISYSPQEVLTIQGAETTFESVVDIQNVDRDAVKTALARAFLKPEYPQRGLQAYEVF